MLKYNSHPRLFWISLSESYGINPYNPYHVSPLVNVLNNDNLILEFPENKTCYRITNIKILDDTNFTFIAPFTGYFSNEFSLLKSNWHIDITLVCEYVV